MPEAPGLLSVGVISTLLVSRFRLEGTSEPEGAKTKTVSPSVASKLETVAVAQWPVSYTHLTLPTIYSV